MSNKLTEILFCTATLALLIPVWFFNEFITVDGPSHVANAVNLRRMLTGECGNVTSLFQLTPYPVPNWLSHILLSLLTLVFSPMMSEKIIFTLFLVLFAWAIWLLLKFWKKENAWLAIPCLLFAYNYITISGTYNFMLGLAFFLFALRWWLVKKNKLCGALSLKLSLIFLLLYFTHIFGLVFFLISIASTELLDFLRSKQFRYHFGRGLKILLAAAPVIGLFLWYSTAEKTPILGSISIDEKLAYILTPTALLLKNGVYNTYTLILFVLALPLWTVTLTNLYFRIKERRIFDFASYNYFAAISIILVLAILLSPAAFSGGWLIHERLQILLYPMLILSLGGTNFIPSIRMVATYLSMVLLAMQIVAISSSIDYEQEWQKEAYEITLLIPDGASLLYTNITPFTTDIATGSLNFRLTTPDIFNYLVAEKCVAPVFNFHAAEKNIFPLSYKNEFNPYKTLGNFRTVNAFQITPPQINILSYEQKTGRTIDYIVIRGDEKKLDEMPKHKVYNSVILYEEYMRQVNELFTLEHTSASGIVRIYKRK